MRGIGYVIVGISLLAWMILTPILIAFESGGPEHRDVTVGEDVPATMYLPDAYESPAPPAVVVGHGYSGDRATMSSLSRSLAEAGYAVLAIDFAGHGASTRSAGAVDGAEELAAALDWLERSDEVDANRLAVLGHSMGAYAVLELVAEDPRPSATVVLGSSRSTPFAGRDPSNLLVLAGESDSSSVRAGSRELASEVEGAEAMEIGGANHISILWFGETVTSTVEWLDQAFGVDRPIDARRLDPRLGVVSWYFLCLPGLFAGAGLVAGRLGPRSPQGDPATVRTFGLLAAALVVAAPVAAFLEPARFLGAGFGDVVSYLAVTGAILYLPRIRRPFRRPDLARTALVGLASLVVFFVALAPLGGVFHRLVPTLQRAALAGVMAPLLALFFVGLQATTRRGPLMRATGASVAAHFVLLVVLAAGVGIGVWPGVVGLALPLLAAVFAAVEVFGSAAHSAGRNGVLVGLVESLWVAGLAAVVMPLP